MQTFRDLKVWQKAHKVALDIYKVTNNFPNEEKYGLVSQIRRAAVSVPSNIVEGFKRRSKKDSLNFYTIAEASLEELRYQLLLSWDLKYMSQENYQELNLKIEEVGKMLFGFKKAIQKLNP